MSDGHLSGQFDEVVETDVRLAGCVWGTALERKRRVR
jgi:hypothetical protein